MDRRYSTHVIAKTFGLILLTIALGWRVEATEKPVVGEPLKTTATACKAEAYANLIGQDKSVLDALDLPDRTRILMPNAMMTMDYSPARLNFFLDATGKIKEIKCG